MKSLKPKWNQSAWIGLPVAGLVLGVFAFSVLRQATPACDSLRTADIRTGATCATADVASQRPGPGQESSADHGERLSADFGPSKKLRYSDRRIRMLNDMAPMPENGGELLQEIDRLSVQQQRFDRRYGPDSVASRSVRDRLRDLYDHAATGSQYAAQEERGAADD